MAKLHDLYKQEVIKKLMDQFHYKTVMQVPRLVKITLNMGVGEALTDKKILENAAAGCAVCRRLFPWNGGKQGAVCEGRCQSPDP